MTNSQKLRIEHLPISALRADPDNARTHSDKQISLIAGSIERFGFYAPIVVDENNLILAGNGRFQAAAKLGITEIPVTRVNDLSETDRRALALADNKIAELAGWDDKAVQRELNRLFDDGYDLEITGFSTADLDFSIPDDAAQEPEEVELPGQNTKAVTKPGDLWRLGDHRILCGDARSSHDWEQLLGDDRAALVFADLPYNVPIDGFVSGNGKVRHREFLMGSGELSPPEFIAFMREIFRNCVRFSANGSIHYQCMDWRHIREILDAADGVYDQFKQLVIWNKGVGGQGAFYRSQHELVFVFKSGSARHINNFGLGQGGRYRTNVVDYPGANSFRKGREADLAAHATVKPTALVVDFVLDCSNRGDLIADPCLGSGTTILAAAKSGRRGAGIELDPLYVDTAIRRITAATGIEAVLENDGRCFGEVADERLSELSQVAS
jgi:DNA modification methylase